MQSIKSNKLLWIIAITIVVVGVVIGLVLQGSKDKEHGEKVQATAVPTPTSLEGNHDHDQPAISELVEATPISTGDNLTYLTTTLQDEPTYDEAKVQSISIQQGSDQYAVPETREYVILQSLYWLDLSVAKSVEQTINEGDIFIYIHSADQTLVIPYDRTNNTFQLGESSYYASAEVAKLMAGIFHPDSELAKLDVVFTAAYEQRAAGSKGIDESLRYDAEQFKINNMDFNEWKMSLVNNSEGEAIAPYYDEGSQTVSAIYYYDNQALLFDREIVFISDRVETKDGIKLGLTKEEVLSSLGKPNLDTEAQWSYSIGDYLKFHLYFDNNKVAYISLTSPL